MARKPDTKPRKQPVQTRSAATVDALLDATTQVLLRHGYAKTTTTRIAERAGVSVGSLYQYYPNKEALVAALADRHAQRFVAAIDKAVLAAKSGGLKGELKALLAAALDADRIAPALHKILIEQVPPIGRRQHLADASRHVIERLEALLRRHRRSIHRRHDPALAAYVIKTSWEALAHKSLADRPELMESNLLADEMLHLAIAYLGA